MKVVVVDAGVVAAAFFREEHADSARDLLAGGASLRAPDLIHAEVANVVWKRRARGEINEGEAGQLLDDVLKLPLEVTPSERLAAPALQLALRTGLTVYDCLYLALAVRDDAVVVTADRKMLKALAGGPLRKHAVWIGERR